MGSYKPQELRSHVCLAYSRMFLAHNHGSLQHPADGGALHPRVTQADGQKSYSCQTRHRLTGEIVASASAGSLFVTGTYSSSAFFSHS
ncbi:hypothetical protein CEXT_508071 [Caerostris extrusa]|uniref:Uncharacterized protein n=1 Tax=Caerostris extrusa TaxID=172846 RepID=A0AAV4XXU0_CAEEX|nr:hypothetical protein CEXT_508071 [Caerostris extrusa]